MFNLFKKKKVTTPEDIKKMAVFYNEHKNGGLYNITNLEDIKRINELHTVNTANTVNTKYNKNMVTIPEHIKQIDNIHDLYYATKKALKDNDLTTLIAIQHNVATYDNNEKTSYLWLPAATRKINESNKKKNDNNSNNQKNNSNNQKITLNEITQSFLDPKNSKTSKIQRQWKKANNPNKQSRLTANNNNDFNTFMKKIMNLNIVELYKSPQTIKTNNKERFFSNKLTDIANLIPQENNPKPPKPPHLTTASLEELNQSSTTDSPSRTAEASLKTTPQKVVPPKPTVRPPKRPAPTLSTQTALLTTFNNTPQKTAKNIPPMPTEEPPKRPTEEPPKRTSPNKS